MSSLLRSPFHVYNAKRFVDTFNDYNYYIGLMREGSTGAQLWSSEPIPDDVNALSEADTVSAQYGDLLSKGTDFWGKVGGFVKVNRSDISMVTRNPIDTADLTYKSGRFYNSIPNNITSTPTYTPNVDGTATVNGGSFYYINSTSDVFLITSPNSSAIVPETAVALNSVFPTSQTSDITISGITFKYLYTIDSVQGSDSAKFITDNFIPVNYGASQLNAGENSDSIFQLGAKYVGINVEIPSALSAGENLYRAAFLIVDPKDGTGSALATASTYTTAVDYGTGDATNISIPTNTTDFSTESGQIVLWDNFNSIQRTATSSEKHLFILEF